MKKYVALLLVVLMTVIGVCGCNSNDTNNDYTTDAAFSSSDALAEAKQRLVNHYCTKEGVEKLKVNYGTEEVVPATSGGWKVKLVGYYYPVNAYGEIGEKEKFWYNVGFNEDGSVYTEDY